MTIKGRFFTLVMLLLTVGFGSLMAKGTLGLIKGDYFSRKFCRIVAGVLGIMISTLAMTQSQRLLHKIGALPATINQNKAVRQINELSSLLANPDPKFQKVRAIQTMEQRCP